MTQINDELAATSNGCNFINIKNILTYSFFGTCFEDYDFIEDFLRSIINQSIKANEIILIDANRDNGINQTLRRFN